MTKIKKDKIGLFIEVDGLVARPEIINLNFPKRTFEITDFKEGQTVQVDKVNGTLKINDKEYWTIFEDKTSIEEKVEVVEPVILENEPVETEKTKNKSKKVENILENEEKN